MFSKTFLAVLLIFMLSGLVFAQTGYTDENLVPEGEKIYSPYVERTATDKNFAEGLYWGDTHLHSSYS